MSGSSYFCDLVVEDEDHIDYSLGALLVLDRACELESSGRATERRTSRFRSVPFDSLDTESIAILANSTFGLCAMALFFISDARSAYPARMTGFMQFRRALLQVGETLSVQVLYVRRVKHNPVRPLARHHGTKVSPKRCLFCLLPSKLNADHFVRMHLRS